MKAFLVSLLLTTAIIMYFNLPAVMARPIDIIPRIIFYLAFPISVFVTMLGIMLMGFFGWSTKPVGISDRPYDPAIV